MNAQPKLQGKAGEWIRRYLPNEIAGTAAELGAAAVGYLMTDSLAVAAIAASVGASVGYYAAAYLSATRLSYPAEMGRPPAARLVVANLLALRSVLVEFGPAELFDSIFVRPLAFYFGPLLFGHVVAGWMVAKLVADVAFYAIAILSYERFKNLLVLGQSAKHVDPTEEVPGGYVAASGTA